MPDPLNTVVGDTSDDLLATLQDGDVIHDLTGLTVTDIVVEVINAKTGVVKFTRDISAIDGAPTLGNVSVIVIGTDVDTVGTFLIYFIVTTSTKPKTYPNKRDPWVWNIEAKTKVVA